MKFTLKKNKKSIPAEDTEQEEETGRSSKPSDDEVLGKPKNSWASTGFAPLRAAKARVESGGSGKFLPSFYLKDGEEAVIRILTAEPMCVREHRVQIDGKFVPRTCLQGTGQKCPLCEQKGNRARTVGIFAVVDRRTDVYTDHDGNRVKRKNSLKLWRTGVTVAAVLDAMAGRKGKLTGYDIEVTRVGEGKRTVYNCHAMPPEPLSEDDLKKKADFKKFNLLEYLAPKKRAEILGELGSSTVDDETVTDEPEE